MEDPWRFGEVAAFRAAGGGGGAAAPLDSQLIYSEYAAYGSFACNVGATMACPSSVTRAMGLARHAPAWGDAPPLPGHPAGPAHGTERARPTRPRGPVAACPPPGLMAGAAACIMVRGRRPHVPPVPSTADPMPPSPTVAAEPPSFAHLCQGVAETVEPTLWLEPLLAAAAAIVGAERGALLGADGRTHAALAWGEGDAAPLLAAGGALRARGAGAAPGPGEWRLTEAGDAPADGWPAGVARLLWMPLFAGGMETGALLLADPARGEAAGALRPVATLAALVLENARLAEEARQATQLREHFLTALHHELRTPATGLVLHGEMLREEFWGPLPPRLAEALGKVEGFVGEIVAVLDRLRELGARVGARTADQGRELVEPRRFVGDLLRRVEPVANRKGLRLALFYPKELPALQTDAGELARVLLHVLGNAIRFTERGRVEVRLSREMATTGRRREPVLCIVVSDTGPGIPAAELERVFEPFAQVAEGARTASRTRGVGLGLPLARTMARGLGGDLTLESPAGGGTRATITIPYQQETG